MVEFHIRIGIGIVRLPTIKQASACRRFLMMVVASLNSFESSAQLTEASLETNIVVITRCSRRLPELVL